jgi:hypothetical protein
MRRWVSPDPLVFTDPSIDESDSRQLNLYHYSANNPVGLTDPDGMLSGDEAVWGTTLARAGLLATIGPPLLVFFVVMAIPGNVGQPEKQEGVVPAGEQSPDGTQSDGNQPAGAGGAEQPAGEQDESQPEAEPDAGGAGQGEGSGKDSDRPGVDGYTKHGLNQKITRQVKSSDVKKAIKSGVVGQVKTDSKGRPSQKLVGRKATVVVNPKTKKIVTVHPTSSNNPTIRLPPAE